MKKVVKKRPAANAAAGTVTTRVTLKKPAGQRFIESIVMKRPSASSSAGARGARARAESQHLASAEPAAEMALVAENHYFNPSVGCGVPQTPLGPSSINGHNPQTTAFLLENGIDPFDVDPRYPVFGFTIGPPPGPDFPPPRETHSSSVIYSEASGNDSTVVTRQV